MAGDDGEAFGGEDLLGLGFGVGGPGAYGVEAEVGHPVTEGAATLVLSLEGEGEVVVGVGVSGNETDGLLVGFDSVVEALHLVEDVAEVEEGEGVFGVGLGGAAVHLLGADELTLVIEDGAEIDAGGGVAGLHLEDLVVEGDGFFEGGGGFFELDGADEHLLQGVGAGGLWRSRAVGAGAAEGHGQSVGEGEVEGELLGDGVDEGATVTEGEAGAMGDGAGFFEGIVHAGGAFDGVDLDADAAGGDAAGAHFAECAEAGEMLEGVVLSFGEYGDQAFPLPSDELPGLEVKDAEDVLTGISGHGIVSVRLGLLSIAFNVKLSSEYAFCALCQSRGFGAQPVQTGGYRVPNEVPHQPSTGW